MALPKSKQSLGRYDLAGATSPANGLGRPAPSQNVRTAVGAVKDPWAPSERTLVAVNRRVSLLEHEYSHHLITESQYQAGKRAEQIFEKARGPGSSNWQGGSRVDVGMAADLAVVHGLEDARKIHAYVQWIRGILGMADTALLVEILRDRKTYAQCATSRLKLGARGVSYIATRFRDALETLAEAEAAKGKGYGRDKADSGRDP